ncbi:MAG TPA: transposase [Labilithrix sp.]
MRSRAPNQVEMKFPRWGGKRDGAGRPRGKSGRVRHGARPRLSAHTPVLVTMRTRFVTSILREQMIFRAVRALIARVSRGETRVVHFSVQRDHMHLIVEAPDKLTLARRMQGLASGVARLVNRALGRRLPFWNGRYHREDLRSPREVRNRLVYVLMNFRKHRADEAGTPTRILDPFSSALWLDGWAPRAGPWVAALRRSSLFDGIEREDIPVRRPTKWLLTTGWKRHGLLLPTEAPRSARTASPSGGASSGTSRRVKD